MKPKPKLHPKHPIKVNVWDGINKKVPLMFAYLRGNGCPAVLQRTLLPFIQDKFPPPSTYKPMQDYDPKHCSRYAQKSYEENGINWGTPHLDP